MGTSTVPADTPRGRQQLIHRGGGNSLYTEGVATALRHSGGGNSLYTVGVATALRHRRLQQLIYRGGGNRSETQ
jgi:hypothetical protein